MLKLICPLITMNSVLWVQKCLKMFFAEVMILRLWLGWLQIFAKKRESRKHNVNRLYAVHLKGWLVYTLQTIFHFCIPKKGFSQASLLISTKYFRNRIIMLGLEFQMVPWICYFLFFSIYLGFGIEVSLISFQIM